MSRGTGSAISDILCPLMKPTSLVFLVLLAFPFFVGLEDSSLWDANEAFYAQTPREMIQRGDWLVPYFNAEPRLNKPPLSYWVVALFYNLFSVSALWERFPMALLAYGSVLAVYWIGRVLFHELEALWGAGIFATTFRFLILSRRLMIDILMLFCVLVALAFFLSWLRSPRKSHFLFSALFFGLAFLAKGPVALLPLVFLGLYLLWSGRFRHLHPAPWLGGVTIFLLVGMSWFVLLGLEIGWDPFRDFFLAENLGRFTHLDFGPQRGAFYYVGVLLGDFFPWSLFLAGAILWWVRTGHSSKETDHQSMVFLALWMVTYMVFFSLSHNKQEQYILPLYPAAALWVAVYFRQVRLSKLFSGLVGVLVCFSGLVVFQVGEDLFPDTPALWLPLFSLPFFFFFLIRRRFHWVILSLVFYYFAAFGLYLKPLEAYQPVRHFARTIRSRTVAAKGEPKLWEAGYYRFTAPSLVFYLDRPILELYEFEEAVSHLQSDKTVYLIVNAADHRELERAVSKPLQIVEVRPKLYTTARTFIAGLQRGRMESFRHTSTRPVYLITNQ